MTHEEHKEALALAALGEDLGPGRRELLEVHLAACGECRAELRELSDAAAMLALSPEPAAPSPELRSRVLSGIRATPQERAAGDSTAAGALGAETPTPDGSSTAAAEAPAVTKTATANVVPFDAERRERERARGVRRRPALLFGYLAASLAIAALSLTLALLWQRNNQLREELVRVSVGYEASLSELAATRTELARARGEAEMLSAPDTHVAELTGTEVASEARARLAFSETTGEAVLVAAELPPPPAGKAYQLWYITGGKPLPGPVFTTDQSGRGALRERIPPEGRRAALFAVTLEPAGGVPAPTGDMYLKGPAS